MNRLDLVLVTDLKGVAKKMADRLTKLGLNTVQDILFHIPLQYEDLTQLYPGSHSDIEAVIQSSHKHMLSCTVRDNTGSMVLRFFNLSMAQKNGLENGSIIRTYGEVRRGKHQSEMIDQEYKLVSEHDSTASRSTSFTASSQ